jgi:hypothetical protein
MNNSKTIQKKLFDLRNEHRDLDEVISQLTQKDSYNQIKVQRLKKRKLSIKDQILTIEKNILPDIIA